MPDSADDERFYDAARLREHAQALRALAEAPGPAGAARRRDGAASRGSARATGRVVQPAHGRARHSRRGRADVVAAWIGSYSVLSTRTVDKEVVSGAALEDRLLLLDLLGEADPRLGTLVVNRGLYVDQAKITRAIFPSLGALVFLVGFDKIVQIFDPRYYDDRDAALEQLFGLATFLVAPRGSDDADALAALLTRPDNHRFAGAVEPLDLPPHLREVASSQVRQAAGGGATRIGRYRPLSGRSWTRPASTPTTGRYQRRLAVLAGLAGDVDTDAATERLRDRLARANADGPFMSSLPSSRRDRRSQRPSAYTVLALPSPRAVPRRRGLRIRGSSTARNEREHQA